MPNIPKGCDPQRSIPYFSLKSFNYGGESGGGGYFLDYSKLLPNFALFNRGSTEWLAAM